MTSFSEVKQPELESYHSSLPTIQNYASSVASSAPHAFTTLFLIPGIIVSNTVVLTRAVAERNMRPACGLVDTKPGTDVTRTTVVAGCLHQQVGARGRVPTASIRPHCVVLHYEQRGSWDTPDELNQLCFYMYQKKPPVLTSTTTPVTLTEGFVVFSLCLDRITTYRLSTCFCLVWFSWKLMFPLSLGRATFLLPVRTYSHTKLGIGFHSLSVNVM
jgi:hypothetical protein